MRQRPLRLGNGRSEKLATETRRRLRATLGLGRDELESLARLVDSKLEISFERLLKST